MFCEQYFFGGEGGEIGIISIWSFFPDILRKSRKEHEQIYIRHMYIFLDKV